MSYQMYQRVDNKWREMVLRGEADLCDTLRSKIRLYRILFDYSNFPRNCPVLKVFSYIDQKYPDDVFRGIG